MANNIEVNDNDPLLILGSKILVEVRFDVNLKWDPCVNGVYFTSYSMVFIVMISFIYHLSKKIELSYIVRVRAKRCLLFSCRPDHT